MKILVETLFEQTVILKEEYLEKTAKYARERFDHLSKYAAYTYEDFKAEFGKDYCETFRPGSTMYRQFPNGLKNRILPKWAAELRAEVYQVCKVLGFEGFLAKELEAAVNHYEKSIHKLALRLQAKGLNEEKLEIRTARVGVNIETVLTDGEKRVRAFTIVAHGPIVRPHYRYLIK